jgi:hypothetical protein
MMKTKTPAKPRRNRAPFRAGPQKNNRTGYNGVSVTYTKGNKGRTVMPVVSVYYKLKGKVHNKRFYIHLFPSKKAAIATAVKFRKKMEREMKRERKARAARGTRR